MINKWNPGKLWCRILSVMMTLALTITLLSGCGTSGSTQGKTTEKQEKLLQEEVHLKSSELADSSDQVKEAVSRLEREVEQESGLAAEDTVKTLKEQLAWLEEQTSDWLVAQKNVGKNLSGKAEKTLKARNREFEKQLAANRKQAEQALDSLEHALAEDDPAKAKEQSEILKKLLVEEAEPKTYGENLPGEVKIYEPEEKELTNITDRESGKEEPETLTGEALSELLVTEGDTELNDELKEKAEELATPLAVYRFLKNNIGYEYYYGSRKGAVGTYNALAGNDLDQASLLIAMLRYLGYEAEYVRGSIYLTEELAVALTGADDIIHASNILAAAGTPVVKLTQNGRVEKISMEHVWVRAHIPYTDYRGAGNAGGNKVWIDLDTGIKTYEEVENLYDTLEKEGFQKEIEETVKAGNATALETMLNKWEKQITSMDTENLYASKRIIRQEELSYLPLSLQYEVAEEKETFAKTGSKEQDSIRFEVEGKSLGTYTASELAGKNILLSFRLADDEDKEILEAYGSIFEVPAYSVYMKPVLLINGEVAAEAGGEGTALGTSQTFTMNIRSGGKDTEVDNTVTAGSMYAVTLDNQNITGGELKNIYDETAVLKDSVTGENVYSEEYLGRLLSLAGKLYFAQVDIADRIAAELYGVNSTRSLSEGITGYEIRTTSLYGMVTGITEGSLYIDVDTDAHSVVSLNGDKDAPREYMFSTGMISSLYESTVWEELTGYESVSTIRILAKAQEEDIDILLISKANLDTEIEKLNTDETTKQTVINAVNSGKVVTIPAEDVTVGDWHGTGYIVANPETGAGEYMIRGGLNGGATSEQVTLAYMVDIGFSIWDMAEAILLISSAITAIAAGAAVAGGIFLALGVVALGFAFYSYIKSVELMCAYASGDEQAGQELIQDMWLNIIVTIGLTVVSAIAKPLIKTALKNKLVKELGEDFVNRMLREIDITELGKYIKQLRKINISDDIIKEFAEKFGKEGLEWLLSKKHLGLTDDLIRKLLKADDLSKYTDDILRVIKNSDSHADDIIRYITKYGDDITEAVGKYGDDAVEVVGKYGDDAVRDLKDGVSPKEISNVQKYVKDIVDASGNVNASKMNALKLAVQNGTFSKREIKLISKKMSDLGITGAYESTMKTIDFGKYLRNIKGDPPIGMIDPHAHHILFKTGNGAKQQELVKEMQAILRKHGIDPIVGEENLVWAPNNITGQHDIEALTEVADALRAVDKAGGDYDDIVEVLQRMGYEAAHRR